MSFHRARKAVVAAALGVAVAFTGACDDLGVRNPNAPDRSRALATPGDVASLIGGAYLNYWAVSQGWNNTGTAMASMSDHISSSWGNVGMKEFGNEPRNPIINNPAWTYNYVMENAWYNAYGAVVAASDGLRAINTSDVVAEELGARERAFAKFMQGVGISWIALQFDQGFVVDENTDLNAEQELQGPAALQDAGLAKMQEAIDIANSSSFSLRDSWINGNPMTSGRLAQYIHGIMARHIASLPRSPGEAGGVDWNAVINHVDAANLQTNITAQGEASGPWWSGIKTYGGTYEGFVRADYRRIGPAETGDLYENWEATPPEQRQPFDMETTDRRITGAGGPTAAGGYMSYYGASPFPEARGTYYWSRYNDDRYFFEEWGAYAQDFVGPMIAMTPTEMDLLKAEAYIMNGQPAQAVPLINATRTANGQLPAVDVDGPPAGEDCVPTLMDGTCGDLMEALQHEKRMEVFQVSAGIPYFDDRRWGDLLTGTAIHFPIPGAELQVLQMDIYTYGGGGEGSAPSAVPLPGDDDFSIMERVDFALDALKRQQEAFSERPTTKK